MHILRQTGIATALAAAMLLAGTAAVSAKAHDNGIADGSPSGNANVGGETAGQGGNAVSGNQKGGQRGDGASSAGSANNGGKGNSDGQGPAEGGGNQR